VAVSEADRQVSCSLCKGCRSVDNETKYVLCLDDDVEPHLDLLLDMATMLEEDRSMFMATGYPFDIPAPGAGLMSYCILAYHLPLIVVFSMSNRALNVWGGCMLLPAAHLHKDTYGFLKVLSGFWVATSAGSG
jgi:hypothetical protein